MLLVNGVEVLTLLYQYYKRTPTFLRQRLDIVLRNFYDKIYYYSFHIGDSCFLPS